LYKNIKLSERYTLQFRGEMFNAFNHANLYILPGQTTSPTALLEPPKA